MDFGEDHPAFEVGGEALELLLHFGDGGLVEAAFLLRARDGVERTEFGLGIAVVVKGGERPGNERAQMRRPKDAQANTENGGNDRPDERAGVAHFVDAQTNDDEDDEDYTTNNPLEDHAGWIF